MLPAAGMEETEEHDHTDYDYPPIHLHPPSFIKYEEKRKQACQTEVKNTAEHTSSEQDYNYQDQKTTNA